MSFSVGTLEISVEVLAQMLNAKQPVVVIDVREKEEIQKAAFPGAFSIPMAELSEGLKTYDLDMPLVMVCHHGYRSLQATFYALSQGFKEVRSLKGGIDAWSVNIDPTILRY